MHVTAKNTIVLTLQCFLSYKLNIDCVLEPLNSLLMKLNCEKLAQLEVALLLSIIALLIMIGSAFMPTNSKMYNHNFKID